MHHCRTLLVGVIVVLAGITGCSNDATSPPNLNTATQPGVFDGEIGSTDFEITLRTAIGEDHPLQGPFVLRGYNVRYDVALMATVCDLTITNKGEVPHSGPVGITFMTLSPNGIQIINPDNGEHGSGAAIVFQFAKDDGMWTPGEESLARETQFKAPSDVAIGFVARLDISTQPPGGSIGGVVWHDANENGEMDPGEDGLGGVRMLLEMSSEPDTMVTAAIDVDHTTTADDGSYRFDGLDAGFYTVGKALDQDFRGTTPNPMFVILTEDTSGVSSFLMANFGCVPVVKDGPVLTEGDYVSVNGEWDSAHGYLVARGLDHYDCEADTSDNDTIPAPTRIGMSDDDGDWRDDDGDHDCDEWICSTTHGKIRGPVTAVDSAGVEIMGTRLSVMLIEDHSSRALMLGDIMVGDRVEARVKYTDDGWVAYRLREWRGRKDQVHGFIEEVMNGDMRMIRVFGTTVVIPDHVYYYDDDKDDGGHM